MVTGAQEPYQPAPAERLFLEATEEPDPWAAIRPPRAPLSSRFYGPIGLTDNFDYQHDPEEIRHEREQARSREAPAPGPSYDERVMGCLLGGAVGDALGAGVEFDSIGAIRARHGRDGITGYVPAYGRLGAVTDDTQMSLFTLDGLIRAHLARRLGEPEDIPNRVHQAYLRWLHTQGEPVPPRVVNGWLADEIELRQLRAPGNTCLSALRATSSGEPPGAIDRPINDSKGCGAVMRAAPIALWPVAIPVQTFRRAARVGALTHGHPSGYLPAGALAVIVRQLLHGCDLRTALAQADSELSDVPGSEQTQEALQAGWSLGLDGRPTPETIAERLGGGWTGEQALAIAVCAAVAATDLPDGLLLAANHSGDSDSTAAIAGNILGAQHGINAIPAHWLDNLELRPVIETLTRDALAELGDDPPPSDGTWLSRYPLE